MPSIPELDLKRPSKGRSGPEPSEARARGLSLLCALSTAHDSGQLSGPSRQALRLPGPILADKIRIGSPVQWPESQLTANVEHPWRFSRSPTAGGAVTIDTRAFERSELLDAFTHELPDTLALHRGEVGAFAHDKAYM